jgi:ABC-type proline/glycine betaine transport system permease subunit
MMASSGEGRFRRLVPVGGYVLAQHSFLFMVLQAFLERGVSTWWPITDFVMFLYVFVPASLLALVVGVVDGVARSLRRTKLFAVLRIFAFLLITIPALGTALVAAFFLAFDDSNITG